MANLYIKQPGTVWDPTVYATLGTAGRSLVGFLSQTKTAAIGGSAFVRRGTPEWEEYIDGHRAMLSSPSRDPLLSQEQVQEFIDEKFSHSDLLPSGRTQFNALSYSDRQGRRHRLLYDLRAGLICEVSYRHKRIEVFTGTQDYETQLGDAWVKSIQDFLYYDGTLPDAIAEFTGQGYVLALWNAGWSLRYINDGERTEACEGLTPVENVSIDDVLRRGGSV